MFFKKSNSAQEIEASVLESLPQSEEDGIQTALQSLANSAEVFEAMNLPDEAEVITQFMETIASGQFAMVKEAKKKAKKKTKKKSPELTSDKQVDNLAHIGWVFNMPSDCGECSMADDGPKSEIRVRDFGDSAIDAEILNPERQLESDEKNEFGVSLEDRVRNKANRGPHKKDKPLALNKCKECGYDHDLESNESFDAHFPSLAKEEFKNQFSLDTIDVNETSDKKEPIVNRYSTHSRMIETAEELCEEYGYSIIQESHSKIRLHRKKDGLERLLIFTPSEQ